MGPRELIAFLDLPRTGGSGFVRALQEYFGASRCLMVDGDNSWMPPKRLAERARDDDVLAVAGQILYGIHAFADRPVSYATVLRDPVHRFLSEYASGFDVLEWMPPDWALVEDGGAVYLERVAGAFRERAAELALRTDAQAKILAGLAPDANIQDGFRIFRAAKAHLREFKFVGLTERMEGSVALFNRIFGTQIRCPEEPLRRSKIRINYDMLRTKRWAFLDELNALDQEVYDVARSIFAGLMRE